MNLPHLCCILLVFVFFTSHAQEKKISDYTLQELDSLLTFFKKEKAFDKILPYAKVGVQKSIQQYGEQDTMYARMCSFLGLGYVMMSDYSNSKKYLEIAIDIQKKKTPKSITYANNLNTLGGVFRLLGYYADAEPFILRALNLYTEILDEKSDLRVKAMNNLAHIYGILGKPNQAEPLYQTVVKIRKEVLGKTHPTYATSLYVLAGLYKENGNYDLAEPLYKEALKIYKDTLGELDINYASGLSALGALYDVMGYYSLAEPMYKEALNIYKKNQLELDPGYADILNLLAFLYSKIDKRTSAESLYKEVLQIREQVYGNQHEEYAASLNNLAELYREMGKDSLSEPLCIEALNIWGKTLGKSHPDYAAGLNSLANLYTLVGKYAQAESLYKECLKIRKETYGETHPDYIANLNDYALFYIKKGDLENARNYIQQILYANTGLAMGTTIHQAWADSLLTANLGSNRQMLYTLNHIYDLLKKQAVTQNLATNEQQAIVAGITLQLLQKWQEDFSDEADKMQTLAWSNTWVLRALAVLDKNTKAEKAFAFAEMNKGVLLMDAIKTERAYQYGNLPDSLVTQEKDLQKRKSSLEAKILEKRPAAEIDSLLNILNETKIEITDFVQKLKINYPQYIALKYEKKVAQVAEIQKLLDEKTALVEYVIGDSMVYMFCLDKNNISLTTKQLNANILAAKIKDFHAVLSNYNLALKNEKLAYEKYTENAFWFYENLIAPVLKGTKEKGIKKLIIVSDGELGHLPFETFLTKPAPQKETSYHQLNYLINDYEISYNYSATIWKSNKEAVKNKNNGQILAVAANYQMKLDNTKNSFRLPAHQRLRALLKPLPAARKEVETLAETFNGFFALDKDASEKIFKEKASDFAVIHLAMHGLLDPKGPILSSLAFTEDGDSLENNFLHAYEVSKMKLNADLVVLSACETGYGRFEKGNGIASLAQAFSYAGAPAMIVSLWQVSDYATSEIMKNLYQNLADGMQKDEALQQAKMKYMKEAKGVMAHPAFWSPFILMGNTDSITLGRTHVFAPTWIIGGAVLILGGIAFAIRRKKIIEN